jgi:hypothetical protein
MTENGKQNKNGIVRAVDVTAGTINVSRDTMVQKGKMRAADSTLETIDFSRHTTDKGKGKMRAIYYTPESINSFHDDAMDKEEGQRQTVYFNHVST